MLTDERRVRHRKKETTMQQETTMQRKGFVWITVLGMLLVGWVATHALAAELITKTETIIWNDVEVEAVKTADNFIVLFNTAKTMGRPYQNTGMRHLDAARQILQERNQRLPNLSYNAGLYTFAPTSAIYTTPLKAYYPMQPYSKEEFANAIEQLPTEARGTTEIQRALLGLEPVLKDLSGKTIIFLFTDGVNTEVSAPTQGSLGPNESARTPRDLARQLAQKYDICFHVISSAAGAAEKELVRAVASINECSRVVPIEALLGRPEYMAGSLFVLEEKVLEVIEEQQKVVGFKMDHVLFDFNSTALKPEYNDELQALGNFLQEHPQAYVILSGFTDSIGSPDYNLQLSRRRVDSVSHYLRANFKIANDRIVTLWYGDLAPVAPNDTEEGRSANRRVAGVVTAP
jgi:OmpA-OmpF porin, OOP family